MERVRKKGEINKAFMEAFGLEPDQEFKTDLCVKGEAWYFDGKDNYALRSTYGTLLIFNKVTASMEKGITLVED